MFFNDKKKIAGSIVDHFESKFPRERSGKMDFSEAPAQKMSEGGEAEDQDHMEELATHSEAMHEAHKKGDHMAHAHAMKAFLHAHEAHEAKKKDVDEGHVSNEKDSKHVAIAGDEYK